MWNYNIEANTDDGSCIPVIMGCTDPTAFNYDIEANANTDDGSCVPVVEGCMYPIAINYNPNANTEDGSCEFGGCTNPEAENYCCGEDSGYFGLDDTFTDDGSCIIYGCTIEAWYICPESYNPDATINDWSDCTFIWEGCATTAIELPSPGEYPTLLLSDVTDNIVDAYFYLGDERIGCMDQLAVNYLKSAVLDDGSCFYLTNDTNQILEDCSLRVYPQPAKRHITIEISLENKIIESELVIYNILGEILYTNKVQQSEIINIDVEKWTVGIYYVMVKMKNKNLTYKFTVE